MRIQIIVFTIMLTFAFFEIGCKRNKFTPPKDGIVTKEMARRYVTVSVALTKIAEEQALKLAELRKKHGISSTMAELSDSEYVAKYPGVVATWDSLRAEWDRKQDSVYKEFGMPEEEWDWIAGAIISYDNREIRGFIIEEFERVKKEADSLQRLPKDSN